MLSMIYACMDVMSFVVKVGDKKGDTNATKADLLQWKK